MLKGVVVEAKLATDYADIELIIMIFKMSLTDVVSQSIIHRTSLTSIQKDIIHLSSTERAMLIDILWESLDESRVKEIEGKWAAESEERIDAVDRRELQTVDGPSAIRELRSSLRK